MPNMTLERHSQTRQLSEAFSKCDIKPAMSERTAHYTTTYYWHVDDDDDRYITLTNSPKSLDLMIIYRDHQQVEAVVLDQVGKVIDWLLVHLRKLAKNSQSPHAQKLKFGVSSPTEPETQS